MEEKENTKWFSYWPGMGEETTPRIFKLVQYEVSLHKGLRNKELSTIETKISLYLGEVICTGHFLPDDMVYVAILQKIQENEELDMPLDLLSEYSADFDFLILLRRKAVGEQICE